MHTKDPEQHNTVYLKKSKCDHVTPLLKELHWLPVNTAFNTRLQYLLSITSMALQIMMRVDGTFCTGTCQIHCLMSCLRLTMCKIHIHTHACPPTHMYAWTYTHDCHTFQPLSSTAICFFSLCTYQPSCSHTKRYTNHEPTYKVQTQ